MNEVQIFQNDAFGEIRMLNVDGNVLFCEKDVAVALGYTDTLSVVKQHCRGVAIYHPIADSLGRTRPQLIQGGGKTTPPFKRR